MGFDLYAKRVCPDDAKVDHDDLSHYFRANVWAWRPLLALISTSGLPLSYEGMAYNSGAEVTEAEARQLGAWVRRQLADNPHGAGLALLGESEVPVWVSERIETQSLKGHTPPDQLRAITADWYQTSRQHIEKFAEFCECCDGFEVW